MVRLCLCLLVCLSVCRAEVMLDPPWEGALLGVLLGHTQTFPWSIFSTLFARGQQWCGLWLRILQQLVSDKQYRFTTLLVDRCSVNYALFFCVLCLQQWRNLYAGKFCKQILIFKANLAKTCLQKIYEVVLQNLHFCCITFGALNVGYFTLYNNHLTASFPEQPG